MAKDFTKMVDHTKRRMLVRVLTGIITFALLAVKIIVFLINKNMGTVFLMGNFTQELLETILNVGLSISFIGFVGTFFRHNAITIILVVTAVLLSAFFVYRYIFYFGAPKCFDFASKDGLTQVIAQEESVKDRCKVTFYVRASSMWVREIGSVSTDGYRPFSSDAAQIKFTGANKMVVSYSPSEGAAQERVTIPLR